ncbi:DUF6445 family protein [Shewanella salipaludis]|uniref:Uncharacterized protein n=1 Tax=Shewanella salipaludis TaxID=2723052 RepID=A0A972FZT9_9GAMM|nr:DUF6445 family protein [Shewanella salipaludis]NMH65717.1 hypothetical protein [Shewanella salipaludis]
MTASERGQGAATAQQADNEPRVRLTPQILYLGHEKTPLIIIDNFAADLTPLLNFARTRATFAADPDSFYPGVRAPLPRPYVEDVLNRLYSLLYEVYEIPSRQSIRLQALHFSLISTSPEALKPLQRLPHFDTPQPHYFALLHYLNDGPHGNTAFFRHIPTGFERIDGSRMPAYFQSAQQFVGQNATEPPGYFVQSNEHYELYHQVEYRPNRLLIYPGNLLHSTLVEPGTDIDANPQTGRLTANMFIEFK